jgi:serine/threonine protein kinase
MSGNTKSTTNKGCFVPQKAKQYGNYDKTFVYLSVVGYFKETKMTDRNLLSDFVDSIERCEIADFFEKIDFHFSQSNIEISDLTLLNSLRKEFVYGKTNFDYFDKLKVFTQSSIRITQNLTNNQNAFYESTEEKFIGLTIENYKIESFIGAGGFGMVFKGVHQYLKNEVAIKISYEIQEEYSEIRKLSQIGLSGVKQLEHNNIAKIFTMGEIMLFNSLRIYVIMEVVRGGSLAMLPKIRLSKNEIRSRIEIFIKVCQALQYAHNLVYKNKFGFQVTGVMHGDVKPLNILLENEDTPKIIDFMFIDLGRLQKVKVIQPNFSLSTDNLTSAMGTLEYMPKEQENQGIVTIQTEIFTLGATLFELFSPTPFGNFRHKLNLTYSLNANKINEGIIKSELLMHNPSISSRVSKIINKCTQHNPNDRYNSITDLIKDLRNLNKWWNIF